MEICLVRHGIAQDRGSAYPDDDLRPLTEEGLARMREAVAGLRTLFVPDLILTSPLVRARRTAEILATANPGVPIRACDALAHGTLDDLCKALAECGVARVAATGHEPQLSMAVSYLVAGHDGSRVLMKKGAAALIACQAPAAGRGELQWLLQPAALRAIRRG